MVFWIVLFPVIQGSMAVTVKNCSYPAVYSFGDSLSDVGNSIAAFPVQFANAELPPNGILFPTHAADRFCDGKLLIDFLAFGVRRRPIYPVLRGISPDFTYGVSFAASGGTARASSTWKRYAGFNSPFSLDVQFEWLERTKVRYSYYERQDPVIVVQSLPTLATLNSSLYVVYAGYQDYFFSLYDSVLSPRETLSIVGSVVDAVVELVENVIEFGGIDLLVINLPPLGCIPAMLTLFLESTPDSYDSRGCLKELNKITTAHNAQLGDAMITLRAKYPTANLYYGDLHGVYTDILSSPKSYNITQPLKACCGVGGYYNFDKKVTCGNTGVIGNEFVNLTETYCANPAGYLSWDGIHTSNALNKAVATDFLSGKHITPDGGLNCSPDFTFWDASF